MHIINRSIDQTIKKRLQNNPVVAILGPRQCGKSTTALNLLKAYPNSIYLDLEKKTERAKLNDIWAFFNANKNKLICFDEIQLLPEIFSQMRSFVDENKFNGQFLILGSASRDLIQQGSESLAGRISFIEMTPFEFCEVSDKVSYKELWLKGGYPRSLLQGDIEESFNWRENYIRTFLERDIPQLGFRIPARVLEQFWTMLAHTQGQLINLSKLGTSLGVTHHTIKNYLSILEETFVIRLLTPYRTNLKKRLIKSPKAYIRDTGIVHALLNIEDFNSLLGHPVYGFSFESFVIENLIRHYPKHQPSFYRTATGDEIDLLLERGNELLAFEIKAATAPKVEDGFWKSIDALKPDKVFIIAQVESSYPYLGDIWVYNIEEFLRL
ncbi:MAG: ATP-binding protein [gamma proteobacterium symbiont of Taylorina sp.]|nr:ATP-binding protein [gamma proteobacterium symbiont of Taylorina sp.]